MAATITRKPTHGDRQAGRAGRLRRAQPPQKERQQADLVVIGDQVLFEMNPD